MSRKPSAVKIRASRTIPALGLARLLRTSPRDGQVGSIDKTSDTYWRNAGSEVNPDGSAIIDGIPFMRPDRT